MNQFRVALCQLLPGKNLSENLRIGLNACKKAKEMDADLALFPEMWSCGYEIPQEKDRLGKLAISINSPFMVAFQQAAKSLQMAIGMTLLEAYEPAPRNTLQVFDRFGRDILTYAKVHTCDFGDEKVLTPGDDFYTADLDTGRGMVKIGAMICYDREFPESARILMLQGAEIILVPNACPMEINRISQLRARAFENMVGIVTVNYPAGEPDCNGHSTAFDGIAYRPEEPDSRDTMIAEAGEGECILLANFDLDELRTYRKTEVHGNAYRHPQKYKLLLSEEIQEPFVRDDYRK